MIIDLIEHSRGTLRSVEYVRIGRSYEGFTCLQVMKPGRVRLKHIEVGRISRIVADGRTLLPSSPVHRRPRARDQGIPGRVKAVGRSASCSVRHRSCGTVMLGAR